MRQSQNVWTDIFRFLKWHIFQDWGSVDNFGIWKKLEQDTINCEYLVYFEPKRSDFFYKRYVMQLFCADATIFFNWNIFLPVKTLETTLKAYFTAQIFFQYCQPAQNLPKSHILFHKNSSLRDFYTMNLYTLRSVIGQKMRRLCSSQMRKSKTIALRRDLSKTIHLVSFLFYYYWKISSLILVLPIC